MIRLIKKDIMFSSKYVLIAIVFSIALPIFLTFDNDPSAISILSFLLPVVLLGLIIGKVCYIEDSDDIKMFLKSLPYKNSDLIKSRFLELFTLDIIAIIYVTIIQVILKLNYNVGKIIEINIIAGSCILIYYSIYLLLYYKKNYNVAQNTIYILIVFVFAASFISSKFSTGFINNYAFLNVYYMAFFISFIALLIFFSSMCMLLRHNQINNHN